MVKRPLFTVVLCVVLLPSVTRLHASMGMQVVSNAALNSSRVSGSSSIAPLPTGDNSGAKDDTLFIFEPAQSLMRSSERDEPSSFWWGPQLCISGSGYGAGLRMYYDLSTSTALSLDVLMSAARRSEEFDVQDGNYTYVPNKIHRVFILPLMLGVQYSLFSDAMGGVMRPSISAGVGVDNVLVGSYDPYTSDYFQSLFHAESQVRAGGFVGLGATIRNSQSTSMIIDARYYVLPYGAEGVESIRGLPMTNFDGLFLCLTVAFR